MRAEHKQLQALAACRGSGEPEVPQIKRSSEENLGLPLLKFNTISVIKGRYPKKAGELRLFDMFNATSNVTSRGYCSRQGPTRLSIGGIQLTICGTVSAVIMVENNQAKRVPLKCNRAVDIRTLGRLLLAQQHAQDRLCISKAQK